MDGRTELSRRVTELDEGPWYRRGLPSLLDDLDYFIEVMERITSAGPSTDLRMLPRASPTDADVLVGGSRLLARLENAVPEIVTGPLRLDAQYWMSWGTSYQYRTRRPMLDEAHFVGAQDAPELELSNKPFHIGLFTCTGVLGTYGMWHIYLSRRQGGRRVSDPPGDDDPPWHTWAVEPETDVVVLKIASAAQWVDFVLSHPRRHEEEVYPDWKSVAQRYDAVHMTLRAIAATQGLYFPTDQGLVAPTFWDVESTFWLRWRFRSVRLVETVTTFTGS